jgi:hypothetical protein
MSEMNQIVKLGSRMDTCKKYSNSNSLRDGVIGFTQSCVSVQLYTKRVEEWRLEGDIGFERECHCRWI